MDSSINFVRYIEEFGRRIKRSDFMTPIFEAVSNAIHAIDEKGDGAPRGRVVVELLRDGLGVSAGSFRIVDDGVGFTDENLDSFKQFHSDRKKNVGGKGVGHASWLVCFKTAEIESVYRSNDGLLCRRRVVFSLNNNDNISVETGVDVPDAGSTGSSVLLRGVRQKYSQLSCQTLDQIAVALFNCFFLEITRGVKILVKDNNEIVDLSEWKTRAETSKKELKGETFSITTARVRKTSKDNKHQAFFCAHSRAVSAQNFEELCGVPSSFPFADEKGEYFVNAFVQSRFLDRCVNTDRTRFDFPEDLFNDGTEPTQAEIENLFSESFRETFRDEIEKVENEKKRAVDEFLTERPQYVSLRNFAAPELSCLKANATAKDIDRAFYLARARLETLQSDSWNAFKRIDSSNVSSAEISKKFVECLQYLEKSKKADLAAYVLKRKAVIEILEYLLNKDSRGAFQKERAIHELIYPMKTTSHDEESWGNNIWLIDDKLIPYEFIASDVPIKSFPGVDSNSKERPDLLAFDNPMAFAIGAKNETDIAEVSSLVVVEFKRPMRDDYDDKSDPLTQVRDYVVKLREGYKNAKGRGVRLAANARVNCYIVANLTDSLVKKCYFLHPTQDGEGFFNMIPQDGTYIEVISYDKLLKDAKKRNAEFFRQLSLPESLFIEDK